MMRLRNIREPDCLSDASFHSGGGFKTLLIYGHLLANFMQRLQITVAILPTWRILLDEKTPNAAPSRIPRLIVKPAGELNR
jgi:hypothetical protein